ncbi:MAG TPA: leucyl aminopeptidase, partial [Phenylobacterium sp.]|nr:leucyl aminopeptidase [Phenylobacterium sp.]
LVDAMAWTRDVSNEPANVIYPESFVDRARSAFAGVSGVTIEVLDVDDMQRLGMGAILGVGRGSARPPRMLVIRYTGQGAPSGGPIVLAGKGITFDTGGITIKPGANMGNMKMDMSGAASVTGAALALAKAGAPVNLVAIAALAENMPDGPAVRPADVLTAMNGKTIEIVSTDAEGRLVLADALAWAEANLRPAAVVDVATLTGAVRTALGDDYAGLFSRHDALADQLAAAGDAVGEPLWRLPLHPSYGEDIASTIADLRNGGGEGAGAGTAAHFIGEFISRDIPWAHLDIAGMAYGAADAVKPAGSAGFTVRLLERFVRDFQPVASN